MYMPLFIMPPVGAGCIGASRMGCTGVDEPNGSEATGGGLAMGEGSEKLSEPKD